MSNRKKSNMVLKSREKNSKTKNKNIIILEAASELEPSKQNKSLLREEHKNIRAERKQKNNNLSNDQKEPSKKGDQNDIQISTKNKKKKRKMKDVEEIAEDDTSKVKKLEIDTSHDLKLQLITKVNKSGAIQSLSNATKLNFLNKDEAEVKDEDIDKFCDELTEEDNKTYENWVQLFEANFKKNKNT